MIKKQNNEMVLKLNRDFFFFFFFDPGTWVPMDEDMVYVDTIEFPLEDE